MSVQLFPVSYPDELATAGRLGSLLTLDLLQELDRLYPPKPPSMSDSDRQVWFDAGKRALVDTLWAHFKRATEPSPA